jgi:hypothetical protein
MKGLIMVEKEYEEDNPFEMVGVQLPNQSEAQLRDMALCFAEEFIREGWTEEQLMAMFKNPSYKGPFLAFQQKGDEYIRSVICEATQMWRPKRAHHE